MTYSIILFALILLLLGIYTFFSLRRDGWRRYVGPIGFPCLSLLYLLGLSLSLGGCVPSWAAWNTRMDVMSIAYDEPNYIYLWGVQDSAPKCVALPWTDETAQGIRAQENGGGELEYVWGTGPETEGALHPKPQEPLPPKDVQ
jgi:hypothetical protein